MNLLYVCDEYPPGPHGGMGSMVQVLAREMMRQGHQVFVAGLYTWQYGQQDYENDQGVQVWRFRYGLKLPGINNGILYKVQRHLPSGIKARLNGRKAFSSFISFLQELISKEQIDLIEVPDWNTFAYDIGFRINWPEFPVPLLLKSHGSHTYFAQELGQTPFPAWAAIDKALYQRADSLSAVSRYTAQKNAALFQPGKEISVLYNSIAIPETATAQRAAQQVLFSGTLSYKKGVFSLAKAWNKVIDRHPGATLYLYGKGDTQALQQLLHPSARPSVHFMGHQSKAVLFDALRRATLAVFPSYSETFGLAPVEAMALACPTIFTRYSCGPEIVHDGSTGLLVAPDNIEELTAAICRLLENPALRQQLGDKGREDVLQRFDVTASARLHADYYQKVILDFRQHS